MSLVRCPSCGRAWDGALCFACGHDSKNAPAPRSGPSDNVEVGLPRTSTSSSAPAPAPAPYAPYAPGAAAAARPHFAPLPPLPPLPRPPTGAGMAGVGSPPGILGQPNAQPPPSMRFPTSTGAVSPYGSPAGLPPTPGPLPPIVVTPTLPPPVTPAAPVARQVPATPPRPTPVTASSAHVLNTGRAAQPTQAPERAPAPAPAPPRARAGHPDEPTLDVDRPGRREPSRAERLTQSLAAFPVVFVAGFLLAFVPTALLLWQTPSAQELFEAGQYDAVIALVEARAAGDTTATADELVLAGHAFAALGQRDRMVKTYAAARLLKKDLPADLIVENLMKALSDERAGAQAAALLAEDWKGKNIIALLRADLANDDRTVRHNVLRAVEARTDDPNERARARLQVARLDLRERKECAPVKAALTTLMELAAKYPEVVSGIDITSDLDPARDMLSKPGKQAFTCYRDDDINRTMRAIAGAQKK